MELAIILTIVMIVMALAVIKMSQPDINVPFQRKSQLFTPVERSFIQLLEQAVGNEFRILCRVRLADVLAPRSQSKQSKAAQQKEGYKTQRDWFVSGALESASVAHIRI